MAVAPEVRTVMPSITICDGLGSAALTLDRYSPFVISFPYSTYTSALSKIRSSARLSLLDCPSTHSCSRVRIAAAASPSSASCADDRDVAQAKINQRHAVLI